MPELDESDKRILNQIQKEVPLEETPFATIGQRLGLSEGEVLQRISRLKAEGIIRQISAIFDTRSLGYVSSLVAARIAPDRLEDAAARINEHPGVSHNYRRNHAYNLWFTLAVPPDSRLGLERTVEILGELAGAEAIRLMPTLRLFKIGVQLDMTGDQDTASRMETPAYTEQDRHQAVQGKLTPVEIVAIRELQKDFPLVPRPYDAMAEAAGMSVTEILARGQRLLARRQLRRVAAVLHHRQAGFKANAMGIWAVPEDQVDTVGSLMAGFAAVSHCYLRPTYPDWPYNIFTMVHGRDKQACDAVLEAISQATGISQYDALYSTREYKKVRVRYFTPETYAWEEGHVQAISRK